MLEAEADKAKAFNELSDEDLLKESAFGSSGWYARHSSAISPLALHLADRKPILILHGAKDRQVFMEDYQSWQKGLKEHPDTTFRLYEDLNHLFGDYQGQPVPVSRMIEIEYAQRAPVPQYVIDDISGWIGKHLIYSD